MKASKEAIKLLKDGTLALAQVESNGIRIDTEYLDKTFDKLQDQIKTSEKKLRKHPYWKTWRKRFHENANLGARAQLGEVLRIEGFHLEQGKQQAKTDAVGLEELDDPFVTRWLGIEKKKKIANTFLQGVRKHVCDGYLHCSFSLNIAKTFRSSSQDPNFQNLPIRDPEAGKTVRRAFIPRPGRRIVEVDYSGIEVRIAACYHKDPAMLSYINDPSKDMHRDMAAECYKTTADMVTKAMRYCGKNMFVFPEFYGSFWRDCADNLWNAIPGHNLELADGTPLKEHLASVGITALGDTLSHRPEGDKEENSRAFGKGRIEPKNGFYKHISDVEKTFLAQTIPSLQQMETTMVFRLFGKWVLQALNWLRRNGYFSTERCYQSPCAGCCVPLPIVVPCPRAEDPKQEENENTDRGADSR